MKNHLRPSDVQGYWNDLLFEYVNAYSEDLQASSLHEVTEHRSENDGSEALYGFDDLSSSPGEEQDGGGIVRNLFE